MKTFTQCPQCERDTTINDYSVWGTISPSRGHWCRDCTDAAFKIFDELPEKITLTREEKRKMMRKAIQNPTFLNCALLWKTYPDDEPKRPNCPSSVQAGIHKAIVNGKLTGVSGQQITKSLDWITKHGFSPKITKR